MTYKSYFLFLLIHLSVNTTFGFAPAAHEQIDEQELSSSLETEINVQELQLKEIRLEEILELTEEYLKDTPDFKKILNSTEPVILLKNESEKRALAIIEMPKKEEIHTLDLEEKELITELFQTHHVKRFGNKIVIAFTYKDDNLQPETKEQAIYLLLAAYIAYQDKIRSEPPIDGILNEKQAKALGKKHYKPHPSKLLVNQKLKVTNTRTHEGLSGSTRVKTSTGFAPLKDLQVGDMVACYDRLNKQIVFSQVTHADKIEVQKHVSITINGQELKVAPEHLFHAPALNEWVTAYSLMDDANLCSYVDPNIQDVQLINEKLEVIRISVDSHHNFFITDNNILVHNYIPIVIEVAIAFEIGQGVAFTWAILAPTAMAIATGLFYWMVDKFVADTPRDLSFTPGLMQDYSYYFSNDNLHNIHYAVENNNQTPQNNPKNSSGDSGSSQDPNKDKKDPEIQIYDKNGQDKHIFRNGEGHLPDTPENRELLRDVASDIKNKLDVDSRGNEWYAKTLSNGKQVWALVRNNVIRNGGINDTPRSFNKQTGLSKNIGNS
jgi:hypothetical protein